MAMIFQDKSFEVREKLLKQLFEGTKDVQKLPIRFLSLYSLFATDPERELVTKVNSYRNRNNSSG